jgi:hypothetical protein|nr:MAG TPA_asm: hypothetical protein [Caudoviricetes sp.]
MIKWKATSVNGLVEYEQEAENFKELFDALDERGIISDPDFPLYDTALLEKYGKLFSDNDFKDESGELDYEKVDNFLDGKKLSDMELYELILSRNGEAYYQKFMRETENGIVEIGESDFDKTGKYKY